MTDAAMRESRSPSKAAEAAAGADARWAALLTRDESADGVFVYAVTSTGVYCRPSCAARAPRRENVEFFDSPAEAAAAGFRPCKRCEPDGLSARERRAQRVADLCRLIETSLVPPTLADLATEAGLSPSHTHRLFKSVTGLTPRQYAAQVRAGRLTTALRDADTVTDAIYEAGYGSSGRFYEDAGRQLGMSPSAFRAGGTGTDIRFAVGESSLGSILVACSERGVCAILLGDDPPTLVADLERRFPRANLVGGDSDFERVVAAVVGLVEAPRTGLDLPLDVRGTAFQRRVWSALREIPAGATASYAEVAERIGSPAATRAVAAACAANPLAVAIPCHRVVRRDGGLSGYRWGIERKRALLEREAAPGDDWEI